MTELDYIIEVHRREERRAQAIADLTGMILFIIGYVIYRLIAWL